MMDYAGAAPRQVWTLLAQGGRDPQLDLAAASVALTFDRDLALEHILAACAAAPADWRVALKLAEIRLARSELDQAGAVLDRCV